MTFRLPIFICLTLLTTANASADLIFNLRPVQVTSATTAFVDLVVQSDDPGQVEEFSTLFFGLQIQPLGMAPIDGLFFDTQVLDNTSNPQFVFESDPSDVITLVLEPTRLLGASMTGSADNIQLSASEGDRLVAQIELGIRSDVPTGSSFRVLLDTDQFSINEQSDTLPDGVAREGFRAVGFVDFTFGSSAASVPEPSSVAALLLIVGGAIYRRRKR